MKQIVYYEFDPEPSALRRGHHPHFPDCFLRGACLRVTFRADGVATLRVQVVQQWNLQSVCPDGLAHMIDFEDIIGDHMVNAESDRAACTALASRAVTGYYAEELAHAVFWRLCMPDGVPLPWLAAAFPGYAEWARVMREDEGPQVAGGAP